MWNHLLRDLGTQISWDIAVAREKAACKARGKGKGKGIGKGTSKGKDWKLRKSIPIF
jgi:hypothetical protein